MDSIVGFIVNRSTLTVTLIRIANQTANSFDMSIESRVTGTGPVGATMQPMVVDLVFLGASFGKLELPEVKTSMSGAAVNIYDQHIDITDMTAFKGFVKAIMNDDDLILTLDNGECKIKSMGMSAKCTYKKDLHIKGMKGPLTVQKESTPETNTVTVSNPSPLEINHGVSMFEMRDASGQVLAELKGPMEIKRGEFDISMNIVRKGAAPSAGSEVHLVGIGSEGGAWTNETIRYIDTPVKLTEQFCSLY